MKVKTYILGLLLGFAGFAQVEASSAENKSWSLNSIQKYVGISGGVGRMTGRRDESVFNAIGVPRLSIFASNVRFTSSKAAYSLFAGFTSDIPGVPIFLGPEIYLGRSDSESQYKQSVLDPNTGANRAMQTSIRQSYFYGLSVQAGVHLPYQTRAYALLGCDASQFQYQTFYVPRSAALLAAPANDLSPPTFSASKTLKGFMWGFGVEKNWNSFRVGADIRFINYSRLKVSYITPSGDGTNDIITNAFKPRNIRAMVRLSYLF
ncbi:MAG: hypothetical protein FJX71_05965 [Alphaproteobacteria bacterium]|nr:hypothetical protein [Alphaproteobacteria bacterium]